MGIVEEQDTGHVPAGVHAVDRKASRGKAWMETTTIHQASQNSKIHRWREVLLSADSTAMLTVIVTESVTPLDSVIDAVRNHPQWMHWMNVSLGETLKFLNNASIQHNHLCTQAMFVTVGGELRVGLFDHSSQGSQPNQMTLFDIRDRKESAGLLTEIAKSLECIMVMADMDRQVLYGRVERGLEGKAFPECFVKNKPGE